MDELSIYIYEKGERALDSKYVHTLSEHSENCGNSSSWWWGEGCGTCKFFVLAETPDGI